MNYVEFMALVLGSSAGDWISDAHRGVYTHKADVDVRIERGPARSDEEFTEVWARAFSDPLAVVYDFEMYHNSSFVGRHRLAAVDGGRALLPLPASADELCVSREAFCFALALDAAGTLESYFRRAGLRLSDW